ncbi:MAG: chromosomal replication initiator protein DnaA [Hyphomicrobiales bacterium]
MQSLQFQTGTAALHRREADFANAGTLKETWARVAQRLKAALGEDLFSSWFARMDAESLDDGRLVLSVPTRFLRNWIITHYADTLTKAAEAEFGPLTGVSVQVRTRGLPVHANANATTAAPAGNGHDAALRAAPQGFADPRSAPVPLHVAPMSEAVARTPFGSERGSPLDHALTFETFVSGKSNALAHAAAMRVADAAPGAPLSFNPLYIHSAAGLGKTHLLNAIAWRIRDRHAGRKVLFITAERFMYHFLAALKARDVLSFKDYFHSVDVLIIDDFQFLQGKSMQQEFCHTFNSLVDSKRQVIVAADVPPAQLDSLDQRMRSRMAGGLVVDIEFPDLELRREILASRVQLLRKKDPSLAIGLDVIDFIAAKIDGGGRELEGALNRVVARHELTRAPVTVDLAAMALRDLAQSVEPSRIRIDDILKVVGRHYNVGRADLLSPRRAQAIVRPRQIGMYLAKKLTARSLPEIGRRFGGRDHSTVLHAVRKIEELMASDDRLAREVSLLVKMIEQP